MQLYFISHFIFCGKKYASKRICDQIVEDYCFLRLLCHSDLVGNVPFQRNVVVHIGKGYYSLRFLSHLPKREKMPQNIDVFCALELTKGSKYKTESLYAEKPLLILSNCFLYRLYWPGSEIPHYQLRRLILKIKSYSCHVHARKKPHLT